MKKIPKPIYAILALVLVITGLGIARSVFAITPGLYEVDGNPNCANLYQATVISGPDSDLLDLGPLFGFKYDGNPTGDLTHTLTNDPPWVVTNGPQDPINSVSIFNVVLNGTTGVQFDWTATLGIDAVIVKAKDANAYVYYPEEFGDAGLMAPDGKNISHIEFCYDYELTATKTANAEYTRTYTWDITKDFDGEYWKFIGDAATTHGYKVSVDRIETDSGFKVTGEITIHNPTPFTVGFSVSDLVDGTTASVTCPSSQLAPNASVTCTYTAALGDTLPADGTNTATVTSSHTDVDGAVATADYTFGDPTTYKGYASVNVTDTNGGGWAASGDAYWEYTKDFTCPTDISLYKDGVYSFTHDNTATITETEQSDKASVTVHCYAPVLNKDASTSWEEKYTWDITKDYDGTYTGFIGDAAFDHGYVVKVDQTITPQNFKVYGNIYVTNPVGSPGNMTISLTDELATGVFATVDCGGGATSVTVAPGKTGTCAYSGYLAAKTDGTNKATGTFNSLDFVTTEPYAFGAATPVGFTTINITDSFYGKLGSASGDKTFDTYYKSFQCSSNQADYVNGVWVMKDFVNTASINEIPTEYDSATVKLTCYAPVLDKDAFTSWEERYDWEITKDYDGTYEGFIGDAAFDHDYTVNVDLTKVPQNFKVYGNIYVTNPTGSPGNMTISLTDELATGVFATVDCGGGATSVTVAPGKTGTCAYSGYLAAKTDGINTATGTFNSLDFVATEPYAFGAATPVGFTTINVTDDKYRALGSATDDETFNYSMPFQCSSNQADYINGVWVMKDFVNTASIDEIPTKYDSATVKLTCYAPVLTKDASASYDERHIWDVDKTVDPASQGGFPGSILPWTWTVTVSETFVEENFAVTGKIYVFNPAGSPGNMTVSLVDKLNDDTFATVDCGSGATSITVAPNTTGTCTYSAAPDGRTATENKATGTFNTIEFLTTYPVNFVKTVVNGAATVTDTEIGLNEDLSAGLGSWSFTKYYSHTCSTNRADYFVDGVYTQMSWTITNWAYVKTGEFLHDQDDATTTYTCDASFADIYKTLNGAPAPADLDIQFTLFKGTTQLDTVSTLGVGPNLRFQTALVPGNTYTICEYPVPAGYTFEVFLGTDNILTYAGPPGTEYPTGEVQCFDFIAAASGTTLTFDIENSYPGGAPRTPGYWKNWNTCTGGNQQYTAANLGGVTAGVFLLDDLLPQTVGTLVIDTCQKGVNILSAQTLNGKNMASDAAYKLARNLLAARLNQDAGACAPPPTQTWLYNDQQLTFEQLLTAADSLLTSIKFDGLKGFLGPKVKGDLLILRNNATYLSGIIDAYNNSLLCTGEPSH